MILLSELTSILINLDEGTVPSVKSGRLSASGITEDAGENSIALDKKLDLNVPEIQFSEIVSVHEQGGRVGITNLATGVPRTIVDAETPRDSQSFRPSMLLAREGEEETEIFGTDGNQISSGPIVYAIPVTITTYVNSLIFSTYDAVNNLRMRITDNDTGEPLRYVPNKAAWDSGIGGIDLAAGDQEIDFLELNNSPVPFVRLVTLRVEIVCDNYAFNGLDVGGGALVPTQKVKNQNTQDVNIVTDGFVDVVYSSNSPADINPNSRVQIAFSDKDQNEELIANFKPGLQYNDTIIIEQVVSARGNTLVLNSVAGFALNNRDGDVEFTNQLTMNTSTYVVFRWGGSDSSAGRWRLYTA